MTEPSQYFKGRTVQEQMNEVIGYVDTRAAEVATTAIASDVAQVHQDMLDADADAQAAAASAAAAAGTLANAVKKTGEASQSIAGDIAVAGTLSGGVVTGTRVEAPTPVFNNDAANKKYVDDTDAALKTYVDNQDALDVHLAGNQTIPGVKTFSSSPVVPTVATGTTDTKAANGTKVKNELDNYAAMVRTTNNQPNITGNKFFTGLGGKCPNIDHTATPAAQQNNGVFKIVDMNNNMIAEIRVYFETNGNTELSLAVGEVGWNGTAPHQRPRLRMVTRPDGKGSLSFFNGTSSVTLANFPS